MLYITQKDYERIITHCKKELPNEACGLIGGIKKGKNKYIKKVYLLANMDASRVHLLQSHLWKINDWLMIQK